MIRTLLPMFLAIFVFALPARTQPTPKLPIVEPIKHKAYTEKVGDKLAFDMVPIPGGTYMIGSPETEKGRGDNEGPQRPVTIKAFWMAKLECAWDQYDVYWENRPKGPPQRPDITKKLDKLPDAITSPTPPYEDPTFGYGRKGFPVIAITHHAAMEYCRWLSEKTGKHYRLPTEAEWEWACRAGSSTPYYFGDDPAKLDDLEWIDKNANDMPNRVGKKKANPWGLFDITVTWRSGASIRIARTFYTTLPKDKPFVMPFNPPSENRYPDVVRGGSWLDGPEKCRSAVRRHSEKSWLKRDPQRPQSIWWMTDADWVGFRVVCSVEEEPSLKGVRSKVTWWSN